MTGRDSNRGNGHLITKTASGELSLILCDASISLDFQTGTQGKLIYTKKKKKK